MDRTEGEGRKEPQRDGGLSSPQLPGNVRDVAPVEQWQAVQQPRRIRVELPWPKSGEREHVLDARPIEARRFDIVPWVEGSLDPGKLHVRKPGQRELYPDRVPHLRSLHDDICWQARAFKRSRLLAGPHNDPDAMQFNPRCFGSHV